jgi:hypothetical protein
LLSIFCKSLELLLDRSCSLVYFEGVLNQLLGDTGHVRRTPCKYVNVVSEETGEREFLFGVEVGPDGDFLGCVGLAEENSLHSRAWVQGCVRALLLWHLQGGSVDVGSLSDHDRYCSLASGVFGELDGEVLAVVGDHDVTEDGKDSIWCRHLHDEVGVMGYGHEFGQHGSDKDGVVGGAEVRDL